VIVDQLDGVGATVAPDEADAPLRVHSYAVLPMTIALQLLEAVSGRNPKVSDIDSSVQYLELPEYRALKSRVCRPDELLIPDRFGGLVAERSDHTTSI
jgi:hypothetical protein